MQGRLKSDGRRLQKSLQWYTKMKNKFSTKWKASKQPRKQRKYRANVQIHLRRKFVNVNLSKELRKKYPKEGHKYPQEGHKQNKRSIQIKKGDKVKIMRGEFKGQSGKILEVNIKKSKVIVEGIQAKKQDGSKVNIKLQPSNLQIIELSERLAPKGSPLEKKTREEKKPTEPKSNDKIKRLKSNISSDLPKESQVNEKLEQTEVKK